MEGPTPSKEPEQNPPAKEPEDATLQIFEGIDLDDLPDDVRERITKANEAIKTAVNERNTLKTEKEKTEELARSHQSRADRYHERLKSHNLLDDGKQSRVDDVDSDTIAKLSTHFQSTGMPKAQADAMAKVQAETFKVMGPKLLSEMGYKLGPVIESVGDMHASRLLDSAIRTDELGVLQIPEVEQLVRQNLDLMVQQGATVVPGTIDNLRDLAYGQLLREGKIQPLDPKQSKPVPQSSPKFATRVTIPSGGHVPNSPRSSTGGPPAPANEATADAMLQTVAIMTRGLPKKGGK